MLPCWCRREASALQSTASWIYGAASTLSQTVAGTQVAKGEEYQPLLTQDSLDDIGLVRQYAAVILCPCQKRCHLKLRSQASAGNFGMCSWGCQPGHIHLHV